MTAMYCDGCEVLIGEGQEVPTTVGNHHYDLCERCGRLVTRLLKSKKVPLRLAGTINSESPDSKEEAPSK